jgi:hypothetical protein
VAADIDQLFDLAADPAAKQRLLSGAFNLINCPHCGYQGQVSTPLVYHDPDKELLLTFFPPDLGLPVNEQERAIGGLINQVVNHLPQEKRKAYLFRPQTTLTVQGLVERVLEADGITREMIQAQQQRLNLIQRLMNVSPDVLPEIARQEDQAMDNEFFSLLSRLIETSLMGGDQEAARQLSELQRNLLPLTTLGRQVQEQSKEVEAAVASLQAAGQGLTREKLLDLVLEAPNETRVSALVSLARPGMDYQFFQLLSDRIERARGDGRSRLVKLREQLLELTRQVDQQMEARRQTAQQLLNSILQSEDITEATLQSLPGIDDFFLTELNQALETAQRDGDAATLEKLEKMVQVLQQVSAPPGYQLIEELLEAPDEQARSQILEANQDQITPEFMDTLIGVVNQVQSGEDREMAERIRGVHRQVLRFSMQANMKK